MRPNSSAWFAPFTPLAVVALAGSAAVAGCGSSSGGSPAPSMAPDQSSLQATWKADTVVLDAATVAAKLSNPDATDGVYRFDPSLTQVASMQPGQALVITGVDLVKVDSVATEGGAIVVTTEPASLVDAATDADASWDVGIDMAEGVTPQDAPGSLRIEAKPFASTPLKYSGPLGNLGATETMAFQPDGSLQMGTVVSFKSGSSVLKVAANAVLKSFRTSGDVVVRNGSVLEAYFQIDDIDLDLDLNVGAVAMGKSDDTFKLPVEIVAPYAIGPLPTYVKVGAEISLNPSLSDTSSSRTHAHFHLVGSGGVRWTGGAPTLYGDLQNSTASTMDSDAVSTVTAGLGVELEFPKVSMGVGIPKTAGIEVYMSQKAEVVANEAMRFDGLGLITGNCLTVEGNYATFAGGTMRLAGLKLTKEVQGWGKTNQLYQAGNPDISVCQEVK
jgi:hypothetical protein